MAHELWHWETPVKRQDFLPQSDWKQPIETGLQTGTRKGKTLLDFIKIGNKHGYFTDEHISAWDEYKGKRKTEEETPSFTAARTPETAIDKTASPIVTTDTKDTKDIKDIKKAFQGDPKSLSFWLGADSKEIKKSWKAKGGMEGLMANPGFVLGLSMMQSAAQGKTFNQDILNNVAAATEISATYKDRLKEGSELVSAPSEFQRDEVLATLAASGVGKSHFVVNIARSIKSFITGQPNEKARQAEKALNKIWIEAERMGKKELTENQRGKKIYMDEMIVKAYNKLVADGTIEKITGLLGTQSLTAKATGGPVQANQAYLVGERGPEVFTPKQSGNIVTNDDAMVTSMLLKANPDLQNLSAKRAERILKTQFPDYYAN